MTFAEMRQARGMSQKQVAEHLGVDRSAVTSWEIGRNFPRPDTLIKLAKLYKQPISKFYDAYEKHHARNCTA